jgi:hypothetical protein
LDMATLSIGADLWSTSSSMIVLSQIQCPGEVLLGLSSPTFQQARQYYRYTSVPMEAASWPNRLFIIKRIKFRDAATEKGRIFVTPVFRIWIIGSIMIWISFIRNRTEDADPDQKVLKCHFSHFLSTATRGTVQKCFDPK